MPMSELEVDELLTLAAEHQQQRDRHVVEQVAPACARSGRCVGSRRRSPSAPFHQHEDEQDGQGPNPHGRGAVARAGEQGGRGDAARIVHGMADALGAEEHPSQRHQGEGGAAWSQFPQGGPGAAPQPRCPGSPGSGGAA